MSSIFSSALEKAKRATQDIDSKLGISETTQQLDEKLGISQTTKNLDEKYGVTEIVKNATAGISAQFSGSSSLEGGAKDAKQPRSSYDLLDGEEMATGDWDGDRWLGPAEEDGVWLLMGWHSSSILGGRLLFASNFKPDPSGFPSAHYKMLQYLCCDVSCVKMDDTVACAGSMRGGVVRWNSAFNNERMMEDSLRVMMDGGIAISNYQPPARLKPDPTFAHLHPTTDEDEIQKNLEEARLRVAGTPDASCDKRFRDKVKRAWRNRRKITDKDFIEFLTAAKKAEPAFPSNAFPTLSWDMGGFPDGQGICRFSKTSPIRDMINDSQSFSSIDGEGTGSNWDGDKWLGPAEKCGIWMLLEDDSSKKQTLAAWPVDDWDSDGDSDMTRIETASGQHNQPLKMRLVFSSNFQPGSSGCPSAHFKMLRHIADFRNQALVGDGFGSLWEACKKGIRVVCAGSMREGTMHWESAFNNEGMFEDALATIVRKGYYNQLFPKDALVELHSRYSEDVACDNSFHDLVKRAWRTKTTA